ncbi:unnamed protein product [Linum tenue]|uniref:Uncharacterized protein n=1 Tax=Linum tenue TaxID=586396 RepID=A0AAV0P890_9ROSI|nr:unnamed protein product [Linum tenue]
MATEILRPQDCLTQRIRVPPCRRRNFHYHGHANNGNGSVNNHSSNSSSNSSSGIPSSNPRFNRKPAAAGQKSADHQRKRHQPEPSISKRSTSADDLRIPSSKNHHHQSRGHNHSHSLVMDKVTILRRGELLDSRTVAAGGEASSSVAVNGTERIGPCPEAVPRQIRITDARPPPPPLATRKCDVYAGSAFAMSPAPSALPLPSFSKKQVSVDDSATRDLRRLLRLDL